MTLFHVVADEAIARLRDGRPVHAGIRRSRILNRRPDARFPIVNDAQIRSV